MIFRGARVALDATRSTVVDVSVAEGRTWFDSTASTGPEIDLSGFLLLPGLINAHDHLEFNLFPKLGTGLYSNARSWAHDACQPDQEFVKQHRAVDKRARLLWGGIKNLLSGVTTVAHHNPYEPAFDDRFPVRVVKSFGWAHSLDFSPDIVERFRATPPDWPFIVHAAEGTDDCARSEIRKLDALGLLTRRTVLVHAVAATAEDFQLLASRGTSVVWCPTSNLSLFGETIRMAGPSSGVAFALGTDSAISAQTDLVAEIAFARTIGDVPLHDLYQMVTTTAARILRLRDGEGTLSHGRIADFLVVRDHGQTPAEALLELQPECVAVGGQVHLMNEDFRARLRHLDGFHSFHTAQSGAWFTDVDLPWLHQETVRVLGDNIHLAGRHVVV